MKVKVLNSQTQVEVRDLNLEVSVDRRGECLLGRSPRSGLVLDGPDVSRLHGKIVLEDGLYYFYDLGSANGSLVNGQIVQPNQGYRLNPGDIIRVGEFVLFLQSLDDPTQELAATVLGDPNATVLGWIAPQEQLITASQPESVADRLEDELDEQAVPLGSANEPSPSAAFEPLHLSLPDLQAIHPIVDEPASAAVEHEQDRSLIPSVEEMMIDASVVLESNSERGIEDPPFESKCSNDPEPDVELSLDVSDDDDSMFSDAWSELVAIQGSTLEFEPQSEDKAGEDDQWSEEDIDETDETNEDDRQSEEDIDETNETNETNDLLPLPIVSIDPTPGNLQPSKPARSVEFAVSDRAAGETDAAIAPTTMDTAELSTVVSEIYAVDLDAVSIYDSATISAPEISLDIPDTVLPQPTDSEHAQDPTLDASEHSGKTAEMIDAGDADSDPNAPGITPELVETALIEPDFLPSQPIESSETFHQPLTAVAATIALPLPASAPKSEVSETIAAAPNQGNPNTVSPAVPATSPQPLTEKYIALLAHENQQPELLQFAAAHCDFLAQCLTVTTPSLSSLLVQTGLTVTQQTPAVPPGGYQYVNGLITSGKILAVIFLRDFYTHQPTQANDEALSRSCNIHQVLFANNLATADAIVHYVQATLSQGDRR